MDRYRGWVGTISIGWFLALLGLILVIVFWAVGEPLSQDQILGLFALSFLARLL